MRGKNHINAARMSTWYPIIVVLLCSAFLSCEALVSFTTLHKKENEPRNKSIYRSSGRSTRRQSDAERNKARNTQPRVGPKDVWSDYMAKFDLAQSHGSGIYVDLGGNATIKGKKYRIPSGRCPVMGKVITLGNGADFLNQISTSEPRDKGLAFPETNAKKTTNEQSKNRGRSTRVKDDDTHISPVSAKDLAKWNYEGNDVANCAEYASNIVPLSESGTKYRYPFVYDSKEEMCHILYTPMQYNQGHRYCDNDGSKDEGASSLLCMRPVKSDIDSHLYYGSANLDPKWEENCPMAPVRDAIFGKWANGSCVAITPAFEEYTDSAEECAALVFENSAADIDIDETKESYKELDELKAGFKTVDLGKIAKALFGPISGGGTIAKQSRGIGMNWANYDTGTGLCGVLDETPNCLIINAGSLALNAIGSPLEQDAVNFPCDIDTNGYVMPRHKSGSRSSKAGFEVTTALSKATLKCSRYVHEKMSDSCGTYFYCSEEPPVSSGWSCRPGDAHCSAGIRWDPKLRHISHYVFAALAVTLLLLTIYWTYTRLWSTKLRSSDSGEYDRLMSKYEYEEASHTLHTSEQQLKSDAYIWGEANARPSDVTPVHLTKMD